MNRMIDRCKNITLPQTSFAGGNNKNQLEQKVHGSKGSAAMPIGIHCMQAMEHASIGSALALEPGADIAKSARHGYQRSH